MLDGIKTTEMAIVNIKKKNKKEKRKQENRANWQRQPMHREGKRKRIVS